MPLLFLQITTDCFCFSAFSLFKAPSTREPTDKMTFEKKKKEEDDQFILISWL